MNMSLTFRTKLLASHVALVAAVVLVAILQLNRSLSSDLARQLDTRLEQQAQGAASWVGEGGHRHPDKLAGRIAAVVNADVTIFDKDGQVAGDSARGSPRAADTGERPEVAAAQRGEIGRASRALPGTDDEMHFVAISTGDGLVLRLGAPLSDVNATVRAMRRQLVYALALALIAALGLGFFAARVAARPLREMTDSATRIAKGDYEIRLATSSPDDFGVLARALQSLAAQLKAKIDDLTSERDRLSAILSGMVEAVLVVDAQQKLVLANPAAAQVLGAEAVAGSSLAEAVRDPSLRRVIESGSGDEEIESRGKSIAVYVRPLAPSDGGRVAVLRDMTRMRKLLTMRRDFVANVSHELRTPLTSIQGYAETLLSGKADPATSKKFLDIIYRQAKRLGVLVEELLTLSELDARPPEQIVRAPVDVGAIARHVSDTLRERATEAGCTVDLAIPAQTLALGDPADMERVLMNLVDNAIKYGRPQGRVRVEAERRDGRVALVVEDDGPGIAAEHLPRLFERFYRVDPSRSRERGGTGLGLAIVKTLVESMGGSVEVASTVGKGTRLEIDLPAAK
jgi:two-component system phosphate regulon sensor histidine kinase PhoR